MKVIPNTRMSGRKRPIRNRIPIQAKRIRSFPQIFKEMTVAAFAPDVKPHAGMSGLRKFFNAPAFREQVSFLETKFPELQSRMEFIGFTISIFSLADGLVENGRYTKSQLRDKKKFTRPTKELLNLVEKHGEKLWRNEMICPPTLRAELLKLLRWTQETDCPSAERMGVSHKTVPTAPRTAFVREMGKFLQKYGDKKHDFCELIRDLVICIFDEPIETHYVRAIMNKPRAKTKRVSSRK